MMAGLMNKKTHYPNVDSNPNFARICDEVLKYWKQDRTFEKSVENRPKDNEFIFFDGPPFANGSPHYGHLLTGFVKDIVARYQTLKGKRVERRFGWDCHGLPVEMEIEKQLGISGRLKIIEYGVDKFNELCRASILRTTDEWEEFITKQARWVDLKSAYRTMDLSYMESALWSFKQLYDKGLVYKAERVMPYSWACQTPLSNFETRLDNSYREVADKAAVVKFKLKSKPVGAPDGCKSYFLLAWTTTPWTLPSNLALAVHKDMKYTCMIVDDECLILAKSAVGRYFDVEAQSKFTGDELVGLEYFPLFDYFKDHPNSFKVLAGDFVTDTDGTGVVHIAPGFGEDDQVVATKHGIALVCPVDDAGKFTNEVPDFAGLQVFEANDPIIRKLKLQGNWFKTEQYIHNYPHCWRTDTPLIYRAMSSWYIKVTAIKEDLIKSNQQINWIPEHIKDGLFGKWLEGARDWSISRNRFWGTPIPIWESSDPRYPRIDVYGSIAELERDFGVKVTDLHRPFIDNLTRPNPDDLTGQSIMRRTTDVFDCWFDSGAMPYSQVHYPFENQERFDEHPSADFIVEYVAQTRGWFYTMMVLSVALFNRPAFLNCICHGVILDAEGQKLSKRLKNYADPREIFAKYGSDALRFVMVSSQVMRGQELCIDKDGKMVQEAVRLVLKPIWNAYNFFTLYANADHIKAELTTDSTNLNDRYILSKLKVLISSIESSLDRYDLPDACSALVEFFEVLNNWYIRRSRARFWRSEHDADKQAAYDTLYTVLHHVAIAASPLLPLLLEHIYLGLTGGQTSVHLQDYPNHDELPYNQALVDSIDKVRAVCTSALNIRNTYQIRTRQPLSQLIIVGEAFAGLGEYLDLIKDEVNVKEVLISKDVSTYAKFNLKINFKEVSTRLAPRMKDLLAASKAGQWSKTASGNIALAGEELLPHEFSLTLEPIGDAISAVIGAGEGLAILNTTINRELELEGLARDVVRLIQQARKKANFHVSDRIVIDIDADLTLSEAIEAHRDYIMEQTLSEQLNSTMQSSNYAVVEEESVEGHRVKVGLKVCGS